MRACAPRRTPFTGVRWALFAHPWADRLTTPVYDVTGLLEPIENVDGGDETVLAAMTEDNHIDQYIARQG